MDIARLILGVDTRQLREGERDMRRFRDEAQGTATGVSAAFAKVGGALGTIVGASFALSQIIRVNSEFSASMSQVAAVSGATGAELQQLREVAIQMGADTAFSATEAADALGLLAQAGLSASQAIEAVPQVLSLAAAGGLGLAAAADITTKAMAGFGLAAADAGRIADVLAKGAAVSNASVQQLGDALVVAGPIARELGISLEETAAAISVLADAGLQGSEGGTALRGVFASLVDPSKEAANTIKALGLSLAEVNPQAVGIDAAMRRLSEAGLTAADAFVLFGREAATGGLVLAGASERTQSLTESFRDAEGAAEEMARVMRDNLTGDIDALTGSIETMIIKLGDSGVTGALRSLAQIGTTALNALTGSMGTVINVVTTVAGAFAAYRLTLLAVTGAQAAYTAAMVIGTRVIGAAQAGTLGLNAALAANPFGAVALAVGVLAGAFIALANAQAQARAETDNLIRSLDAAIRAGGVRALQARAEADVERMRAQTRLDEINAEQARLKGPRGLGSGNRALELEAQELTWKVIELGASVRLADRTIKDMEKTAGTVVVPVAQAANAVTGLGTSLKETAKEAKTASDEFQRLYDRLMPEEAARRQLEADRKLIMSSKQLTEARKDELLAALDQERFRSRTSGMGDAKVSSWLRNGENANILDQNRVDEAADGISEKLAEVGQVGSRVWENLRQVGASVFDELGYQIQGVLQGAQSIGDAVKNIIGQLASMAFASAWKGLGKSIGIPGFARGTNFAPGGLAIVGERGPELVNLPRGSQVIPNDRTERMMGGRAVYQNFTINTPDANSFRRSERQILSDSRRRLASA